MASSLPKAFAAVAVVGFAVTFVLPADVIDRVVVERPEVAGVAVPGMPVGSPGMEVPNVKPESYSVMAFDKAGKTTVYEKR